MKALIIGDCNSIHIINFIRVVLKKQDISKLTIFDPNSNIVSKKESHNFYQDNNIEVVLQKDLETPFIKLMSKIPKLRVQFLIELLNKKIKRMGSYDYCFIHYVNVISTQVVIRNSNLYERIIPVFWGSDLLRNRNITSSSYDRLFKLSHKIVFNTENMKRVFKKSYEKKYDDKSQVIKFPTISFRLIDRIKEKNDVSTLKKEFEIPNDKIVVTCGHAGTKQEQYEKLIKAISECDESVRSQCYFIFLMTYGGPDLKEYQLEINRLLKKYSLEGKIMTNYMTQIDFLKLNVCNDIYITTITTDAFSGVMQENIYTGAILIYGDWLNYYELEESEIFAKSIKDIKELTKVLENIVLNYSDLKSKLLNNGKFISDISSPESIESAWRKNIFIDNY